ncbi:MAG: carboxylesterase family protein [Bacteroidetes bacterium]|nr:carboxylesterase family protein [Bacteroidota bacterium]
MKTKPIICFVAIMLFSAVLAVAQSPRVKTLNGIVEGTIDSTGIHSFKGIPFAQPPVGDLRWRDPQPAKNWSGVLKADHFGPNAMQKNVFGDMQFRSSGMSEDCLYLNVWTPAKSPKAKLPVLVYYYGGGYVAGDGSESRYDGESLATKGIVTVTVNYRLGIFGLFAHPELTKESPHNASGNYGMLDQTAALKWVRDNIAAFGGDPNHITIDGESAGSISVCDLMASPLSRNMIAGAIGESGGILPMSTLSQAEKRGADFQKKAGASSLADLRAMPADKLLDLASKQGNWSMAIIVDGYFLPKSAGEIFAAGEQAHVPLLVGWNSAEIPYQALMQGTPPTPENYAKKIKQLYPNDSAKVMQLYPGGTEEEVIKSATKLASDRFIVYSTWKWAEEQAKAGSPVYNYMFSHPRPPMVASMGNAKPGLAGGVIRGGANEAPNKMPAPYVGASHASEIEYALGNLWGNKVYAWSADDYKVSATMEDYFANFIKTGNPNGKGLPQWPVNNHSITQRINIDVTTKSEPSDDRPRYLFLDEANAKK